MLKKSLSSIVCLSLVLAASTVYASGAEHHEVTVWTYAIPFINFFILVGVLFYFLKAPVKAMFASRATEISKGVAEAQKHHENAIAKFEEIQEKLKNADNETKSLLASIKSSALSEKENVLAAANQFATQLQADTQNLIAQEVRKAQMILREETVRLASELAQKDVVAKLTPEVQNRLQTEFVKNLKSEGGRA